MAIKAGLATDYDRDLAKEQIANGLILCHDPKFNRTVYLVESDVQLAAVDNPTFIYYFAR